MGRMPVLWLDSSYTLRIGFLSGYNPIVRYEIEQSIAQTYRRLTSLSALIMLVGWLWHWFTQDVNNWLIVLGVGILLTTPLLAILHLVWLTHEQERLVARYSLITLALIGVAVIVGLSVGGTR